MLHNYLTIAFRNLLRHKVFSIINICGLAIGMAACLLIVLFITDELSFDQHHAKKHRIYRVEEKSHRGGQTLESHASTNFGLAPLLKTAFPQIENYVRMGFDEEMVTYQNHKYIETNICFADSTFFKIFSFQFVKGDPKTALDHSNTVVITRKMAQKYFGAKNPLGELMEIGEDLVKVTGVVEEMPQNSHFQANLVVSVQTVSPRYPDWMLHPKSGGTSHYTYLLLPENFNPEKIESQFGAFTTKHIGEDAPKYMQLSLQPLTKIHLYSQASDELQPNGSMAYVYIFAAVAIIILVIACVNYMNLTTARSIERAKEVGLRKVVGANRQQLIFQFLGESVLISLIALILACLLAQAAIPLFNALSGKELSLNFLSNVGIITGLLVFSLFVGLLSGSYPAFFLSAYQLTRVLKGNLTKSGSSSLWIRKGLVVAQFSISIILIIATLLISDQMKFIQHKKLGINAEQVITMNLTQSTGNQFETFKAELLQNANVLAVTAAGNGLTTGQTNWRQYRVAHQPGKEENIATMDVDVDFFRALEAEMTAGRSFSKDFPSDLSDAYVINETAAKMLNLKNPVNEPLTGSVFNGKDWGKKQGKIIGVVKDFHFASLHQEIKPVVFNLYSPASSPLQNMWVRVQGNNLPATLTFVEKTWKKFEPDFPLSYTFMNEDIHKLYQAESRFLQVFTAFSCLAIFTACLGIFGLATYTATQRTKEIGIRKVLGASIQSIVLLLSKDFTRLVAISFLIASPVAWYLMKQWLENFAYRIDIGIGVFLLAGMTALLIAWLTISFQSIKTALSNPVKSLRSE